MENHLNTYKKLEALITEEKNLEPNPFLATRVMAEIGKQTRPKHMVFQPVLRPLLAVLSLVMVVWLGINLGSSWNGKELDEDAWVLQNDHHTEGLFYYAENE